MRFVPEGFATVLDFPIIRAFRARPIFKWVFVFYCIANVISNTVGFFQTATTVAGWLKGNLPNWIWAFLMRVFSWEALVCVSLITTVIVVANYCILAAEKDRTNYGRIAELTETAVKQFLGPSLDALRDLGRQRFLNMQNVKLEQLTNRENAAWNSMQQTAFSYYDDPNGLHKRIQWSRSITGLIEILRQIEELTTTTLGRPCNLQQHPNYDLNHLIKVSGDEKVSDEWRQDYRRHGDMHATAQQEMTKITRSLNEELNRVESRISQRGATNVTR